MARKLSNINGMIHASDDAEGWSVKVPSVSVQTVIDTLNFARNLAPQVENEKRGRKRGPKPAKAEASVAEAPKRRGRPPKTDAATSAPKVESNKPKMADVLAGVVAKGPATRDQIAEALTSQGHRAGAIANFLKSKTFNKQGHYIEAN